MIDYPVRPRAISMLVNIRQALMDDDGTLAMKIANCGKYVAADLLADTIAAIQRTEQQCSKAVEDLRMECEIKQMYQELLGDYYPDILTDEQKADIAALVAKWDADGGVDE